MENIKEAVRIFYSHHKEWVKIATRLFILGVFFGAVAALVQPSLITDITQGYEDKFGEDPALGFSLARGIFIQNLTASAIAWIGGLALGIIPMAVIVFNGFLIGFVITYVLTNTPSVLASGLFLIVGLVPHGIIEIPAIILACVLGMKLGWDYLSFESKGARMTVLKHSLINSSKYFVIVILALAVAAILEVYVSGQLMNNF